MASGFRSVLLLITLSALVSKSFSQSLIELPSVAVDQRNARNTYCDSWRLSVETNNAGSWDRIASGCRLFVWRYLTGPRYVSDSQVITSFSRDFAASINMSGDGKEAWVFDIDLTLLTFLPYYRQRGFGPEPFNETTFNLWVDAANEDPPLPPARALPESLRLYNDVKGMGFKIFLITARNEPLRNYTSESLLNAGYAGWDRLILRGPSDVEKTARQYKSEKRAELIAEGYRIEGSSGDQWSDLLGFAVATRSFKHPNPLHYTP